MINLEQLPKFLHFILQFIVTKCHPLFLSQLKHWLQPVSEQCGSQENGLIFPTLFIYFKFICVTVVNSGLLTKVQILAKKVKTQFCDKMPGCSFEVSEIYLDRFDNRRRKILPQAAS